MSERKMATIQKIRNLKPIEGADRIEVATVNNWDVVVAKDVGHKIGDFVIYCEIDSFLPIKPEFEFLRKTSYKKMGEDDGFRLKTIRMRGQLSQGLLLPITVLNDIDPHEEMTVGISHQPHGDVLQYGPYDDALIITEGVDVSDLLGIVKYEAPIPAQLAGVMKGSFPSFIRKTDEERIQNLTEEYEQYKKMDTKWYVTEKLDGSSTTYYLNEGVFGTCSRNMDLVPDDKNSMWKVARTLGLEETMMDYSPDLTGFLHNHSVQGEIIGEGIQGNPYKIKGQVVRFFNLFDIGKQQYEDLDYFESYMEVADLTTVPILDRNFTLPDTIEELLLYADEKSVLNKDKWREGVVIRSHDRKVSFKVISNKFLLKSKD